ncbi:MAG: GAP family protein [Amaricoccus sp.]|uniref:GAP family protein n=1 Tax=Amaricoccus sp. TaxID=1872485 RepID=UPI0039E69ED3
MLTSSRAAVSGPAFAGGFVAGPAGLAAVTFVLLDGSGSGGGRAGAILRIALGVALVALVALVVSKWRKRPRAGEMPPLPGWMAALQEIAPGRAFLAGAALGGVNPKNIAFASAAGAAVATRPPRETAVAAVAFVLLGSASVLLATFARLAAGTAATAPLEAIRGFMVRNGNAVLAAIFLILGAKLLIEGWSGLAA